MVMETQRRDPLDGTHDGEPKIRKGITRPIRMGMGYNFGILNDRVVAWKSSKKDITFESTMEAEYIAAKEAVWMKNYIQKLGEVPSIVEPIVVVCDNDGAIAQAKEPISHH
ncbi:UNVERIFIED_CONTAM: hypothetical protein Scaly_0674800 [Sesamum calycinum]|uniref:Uncharacterized protein n=1 Tax=Sesamum calycinum TaxID=2727403 RepID=A0AAW2R627_9LAMI